MSLTSKELFKALEIKLKSFHKQNINLLKDKICYVGDDTVDVELLQYVGLSVIVPNSNLILNQLEF
jgi:3-deoxy-D-manno-octulosonate 8-phosphate phosphatase KdsC-like HAD superfamily phosphatase